MALVPSRRPWWGAAAGALLLAGCTSLPQDSSKLTVALLPVYSVPGSSPVVGQEESVLRALERGLTSSPTFVQRSPGFFEFGWKAAIDETRWSQTALLTPSSRTALAAALHTDVAALTTVVPAPQGGWHLWVRFVDLASGAPLFSWDEVVPSWDFPAWSEPLIRSLARRSVFVQTGNGPSASDTVAWNTAWASVAVNGERESYWKSALEVSRAEGDFTEAARLLALLERSLADSSTAPAWAALRGLSEHQALVARQDALLLRLQSALRLSPPSKDSREVDLAAFLSLARGALTEVPSLLQISEWQTAFRQRYGLELLKALERPSVLAVRGGAYLMGSAAGDRDEAPVHEVTVDPFLMADTEVTQELFSKIMGYNPSLFAQGNEAPRRPVERVTWFDAVEFCNRLSARDGLEPVYKIEARDPAKGFPVVSARVSWDRSKTGYRLPTEAEWEWAARGADRRSTLVFAGGDDPRPLGRFGQETGGTEAVGQYAPNDLGLFDLTGNVWEWCWDWYAAYPRQPQTNPEGASAGVLRVGRGGSWHAAAWNARVTGRSYDNPSSRGSVLGFRVVRSLPSGAFSPPEAP